MRKKESKEKSQQKKKIYSCNSETCSLKQDPGLGFNVLSVNKHNYTHSV